MSQLFYLPFNPVFNSRGLPVGAAKVYFYATGTTTLQAVYADAGLTTPLQNPVPADAIGKLPNIYMPDTSTYRVRVTDALGNPMGDDIDPYYPGMAFTVVPNLPQLVAPTGASLVGFQQSGTGTVTETVQAVLRREVWAESFGVSASNNGTQNAAAFQAAINALGARGGTVRFKGDYVTNTILIPTSYIDGNTWKYFSIIGSGSLTQGSVNTPIIAMPALIGRVIDCNISGFTVIPAAGSTKANAANRLIDIAGFERAIIDVRYESNPAATSTLGHAYAAISGAAKNSAGFVPCYGNKIRLIMPESQRPSKGVWLHNEGGTVNNNANENYVTVRAYAGTGCDYAVDCLETTQTIICESLFESNAGMTAVRAGNQTISFMNWYEQGSDAAFDFGTGSTVTANNCVSIGDYFSGAAKIVVRSAVDSMAGPFFMGSLLNSVSFVDENNASTTNYTSLLGQTMTGAFHVTRTLSVDGNATLGNASNDAHVVNGIIRTGSVFTVATLPASPVTGDRAYVSDANAAYTAGIGATVIGGGANTVPVVYLGGAWKIG